VEMKFFMRFLVTPFVFEISIGTDIRWVNVQLRGSSLFPFHFHHIEITMKTSMPANERRRRQPHNVYNVFFLLERMRLIDTLTDASSSESETKSRNHMTLMDMNPLLFLIFLHATSICICQWGGSCRERTPNESIQSPAAPVSNMSACCNRLTTFCYSLSLFAEHTISYHLHFTVALPFFELARMVASNYKTIDKETKEYCVTVSNLIKQKHGDLIAVDKLRAQEGHPGEKKKKEKLAQREVPSLATVKTNGDTNEHPIMALNVTIIVNDAWRKSTIITTSRVDPLAWPSNLTTSPSMDTLGTFYGSVASQKNGMSRPPFNVDYPDVQGSANHRVQEMDVFNADIHGMMTEYGSYSGAEFQVIANVNRRAMIAGGMMTDQVIANVNRRASIMAEMIAADMIEDTLMMRASCMALNRKDDEESRTITKINFPPRQLHLPYCQPIQDERCIGMMLCRPTIDEVSTEEGR